MLQVTFSWIVLICVPAYLSLLGVSWTVFHSMFVKVLLPENNPAPVVGLLMQTALSFFSAAFQSFGENRDVRRNCVYINYSSDLSVLGWTCY